MTVQPDVYLPPDVAAVLDSLRTDLRAAAGDNLVALILFGGLARGRYLPATSDINLAVVLSDASGPALERIATPLHEAWRTRRVDPLIVVPGEIARLAVAFPTKILDIRRRHIVLFGEDPFVDVAVDRGHVRVRVEQELRNLELRLRHRFVLAHDDPAALAAARKIHQGSSSGEYTPALFGRLLETIGRAADRAGRVDA
jgi:predicted nucleotidyltransferase